MNEFRVLLLDIAQQLQTDELEHLKFACRDFIPAGRAEFISRPHQLFLELEKIGKLSEGNRDFLALILVKIGRHDLRNKLLNIAESPVIPEQLPYRGATGGANNRLEPYSQKVSTEMILDIYEKISTKWKFLGLYLKLPQHIINNIDDTYKKTEEKSYEMLKRWSETSQTPTVLVLVKALNDCGRRDLAEAVQDKVGASSTQPTENTERHGQRQFPNMGDLRVNLPEPGTRHPQQPTEQGQQNRHPAEAVDGNLIGTPVQETKEAEEIKPGSIKDEKRFVITDNFSPKGGFCQVFLVMEKVNKALFAVKSIDLGEKDRTTEEKADALEKQVTLLRALDNPYLVKYYKTEPYPNSLDIFMEYMPGGSIEQNLKKGKRFDQETVRKYTWQLLKGLEYLHENNVIHRNIKGSNILLDEKHQHVKLSDYGISECMEGIATSTGNCVYHQYGVFGSVFWTSPELLCSEPYTCKTDIWSLACAVTEMLTGDPPHRQPNAVVVQVMYKISTGTVELPEGLSSLAKIFLEECFTNKSIRPSAKDLLETSEFPYQTAP